MHRDGTKAELTSPGLRAFLPLIKYMLNQQVIKPVDDALALEISAGIRDYLENGIIDLQQVMTRENGSLCHFAICAWVDERILNLPDNIYLELKKQWQTCLAQKKYFSTLNAGIEFYENLNSLDAGQNQVLELYYVCLCLGYRGRFCSDEDAEMLHSLCLRLYENLSADCHAEGDLQVDELGLITPGQKQVWPLWAGLVTLFMLLAMAILYIQGILVLDTALEAVHTQKWLS